MQGYGRGGRRHSPLLFQSLIWRLTWLWCHTPGPFLGTDYSALSLPGHLQRLKNTHPAEHFVPSDQICSHSTSPDLQHTQKGVITKGVSSLVESLESLKSLENGWLLHYYPQSGGSLKSLESLNSLESLEKDFLKRPLFQKDPFFRTRDLQYTRFWFWSIVQRTNMQILSFWFTCTGTTQKLGEWYGRMSHDTSRSISTCS